MICHKEWLLISVNILYALNSPFPSCLKPLYQSEVWCTTIHMKMSLIYM